MQQVREAERAEAPRLESDDRAVRSVSGGIDRLNQLLEASRETSQPRRHVDRRLRRQLASVPRDRQHER